MFQDKWHAWKTRVQLFALRVKEMLKLIAAYQEKTKEEEVTGREKGTAYALL